MPVYGLFLLTLRELRARKVIAGLAVVATLVWVMLALALRLDVVDGALVGVRLFGSEEVSGEMEGMGVNPLERLTFAIEAAVSGVAYWMGTFLALFASGGLVASMTERGPADVLLSKPVSRSALLGARLLGVGAVMFALVTYLLGAGRQ